MRIVIEISVIIPTFNRADLVERCLNALARQTAAPASYEVVVVDDGSTDRTRALLGSYDAPFSLRTQSQPNSGQASARNRAIEIARGRFCLFLDDDIEADPGLVDGHLRAQRAHGGVIGIGMLRLRLSGPRGGLSSYFASWWQRHYEQLENGTLQPDFRACFSGNLSAPLEVVRRVRGFDEALPRGEDVEFAYRLQQAGLNARFIPEASAEQHYLKGFREMVDDYDGMGQSAVAIYRRHPELLSLPPLGDFGQGTFRTVILRKALLALRAPVLPLVVVDRFLAGRSMTRLYHNLQLHCYWRSVRKALDDRDEWRRLTQGTVILMYHALGAAGERPSRYVLPSRRFRRQLRWLRLRGYRIISLDEYAQARLEGTLPPSSRPHFRRRVRGNADVRDQDGEHATVFLVAGLVGESNRWTPESNLNDRALLSWDEVRDLRRAGVAVGAHTVSHPRLTDLDRDEASQEVVDSRAVLKSHRAGRSSTAYADEERGIGPAMVREAGYLTACGIQHGSNGPAVPIHDLRLIEVRGTWSLPTFALSVWTGFPPAFFRRKGVGA